MPGLTRSAASAALFMLPASIRTDRDVPGELGLGVAASGRRPATGAGRTPAEVPAGTSASVAAISPAASPAATLRLPIIFFEGGTDPPLPSPIRQIRENPAGGSRV